MSFRVLLSIMVLTSFFIMNAFGGDDLDLVSWTQAPLHAPAYSPVGAPPPHGHHKGGGHHHHHKPAVPPTAHPPTVAPVKPPTKAPAPVKPPTKAPAPVKPPTKAPVKPLPPTKAPVKPLPPTKAPVKPLPPTKAPVKPLPPTKAPVKPLPPTKAPVKPPSHSPAPVKPLPTRRQVAVRGVVFCKACKYKGVDTLMAATPLQGAMVLLTCNNTKYPLRVNATTDKNGFFFIMPPKTLTTYGAHTCKVTLLSSPKATCNQATNLHYGLKGATLVPTPKSHGSSLTAPPLPYDVFTVGPFAYEASKKTVCTH